MLLWIILMWKIAIIDIGISKAAVYSLTQINVAVYDMSKQSMQTLDQPLFSISHGSVCTAILVENLKTRYPEIKAIVKNINMKNTNVILGQENINLYGNGYIEDILGEYKFKISPLSFYQVNPVQAEKLYNLGVSMAEITKNDVVFDLYCGIGTISLFMSKFAKKVYGIEIVEEAVKMAKENAQNNNVSNTEFFAGNVEIVLDDLINNKGLKADVVMFDPPRKGLDKKSIDNILNIRPKKIVYISCNPATLIRDLADFENEYDIKTIIPVDMFPFTSHVECVATLQLK